MPVHPRAALAVQSSAGERPYTRLLLVSRPVTGPAALVPARSEVRCPPAAAGAASTSCPNADLTVVIGVARQV